MNIIIYDSDGHEIRGLTQWDVNRYIEISGTSVTSDSKIHFYNAESLSAYVTSGVYNTETGNLRAKVPNTLLRKSLPITVCVYIEDSIARSLQGRTVAKVFLPVSPKLKPDGYIYEGDPGYFDIVDMKKYIEDVVYGIDGHVFGDGTTITGSAVSTASVYGKNFQLSDLMTLPWINPMSSEWIAYAQEDASSDVITYTGKKVDNSVFPYTPEHTTYVQVNSGATGWVFLCGNDNSFISDTIVVKTGEEFEPSECAIWRTSIPFTDEQDDTIDLESRNRYPGAPFVDGVVTENTTPTSVLFPESYPPPYDGWHAFSVDPNDFTIHQKAKTIIAFKFEPNTIVNIAGVFGANRAYYTGKLMHNGSYFYPDGLAEKILFHSANGSTGANVQDIIDDIIDEMSNFESEVGDISDLGTLIKSDIVSAINEVNANANLANETIGDMSSLTTDEKSTLVGAINEAIAYDNSDVDISSTSVQGAITEVYGHVSDLNDTMSELNCSNLFTSLFSAYIKDNPQQYTTLENGTHERDKNGVTFLWDKDWKVCTVGGSATETAFANMYFNQSALPDGFVAGESRKLKVNITGSGVYIQIGINAQGTSTKYSYTITGDTEIDIPEDAYGMYMRLRVDSGSDADAVVSGITIQSTLSNKDIASMLTNDGVSKSKYYAFGDSVTWGAIWDAQPGTGLHRAQTKYQIPTRIAKKTGYTNFVNLGISGAGYVRDDGVLTSTILSTDLSDASLITVMGGVNDKSVVSLGTESSVAGDGTVCGAIKTIINYVKTNAPNARLVFIQPTPSGTVDMMDDVWSSKYGVAENFWSLNDFDREVSKICRENHVGYVNWWSCRYCDNWKNNSGGYNGQTGPNYSHPTLENGYGIIGNFIAEKISSCIDSYYDETINRVSRVEERVEETSESITGEISRVKLLNARNLLQDILPNKAYPDLNFDYEGDGVYHVYGSPTTSARFVEIDGTQASIPSWINSGARIYVKFTTETPLRLGLRAFSDDEPGGTWLFTTYSDISYVIPDTTNYNGISLRLQIAKQSSGFTIDTRVKIEIHNSLSNEELSSIVEEMRPVVRDYPPLFTLIDDDGDSHFMSDIVPIIEEMNAPIASAVSWHFLSQGEGYVVDTDEPSPSGKKIKWMDWDDVAEARGKGAEILNHTYRHLEGSVASQKSVTDLSYNYYKMKNRLQNHGVSSGSDILVFSSSSGNYDVCREAASYVAKASIKIGGNAANTPDTNVYALSRYRIDYAETEGGTDWDYDAMKSWVDNCAANGGWMIGMFHTSNPIYRHSVAVDSSGNPKYNSQGKLLVLYYESGDSGSTTELPIDQLTTLSPVLSDDRGATLTVGKVVYVPMLKDIISYARGKGVTVCTAEYALRKYYEI